MGGAGTADHGGLSAAGGPAIDILDYRDGFNPTWHTVSDDLGHISRETLGAVGESLMEFVYSGGR